MIQIQKNQLEDGYTLKNNINAYKIGIYYLYFLKIRLVINMLNITIFSALFIVMIIILCVILYLIGKLRSDFEYFLQLNEKQNEFIQDRLYVLEVKMDNINSSEDILFNVAPGKQ